MVDVGIKAIRSATSSMSTPSSGYTEGAKGALQGEEPSGGAAR